MESLVAFFLFAFVASITPGPTNVLVMSNASRHGWPSALPMVIGGCAAATTIVLLVGSGLTRSLAEHPQIQRAIAWTGVAWLSWMAWHLFRSDSLGDDERALGRGRGFTVAATLQLVNPKVWMMALAVMGVFVTPGAGQGGRVALLSLIFFLVALPCMAIWAWLGVKAAAWTRSPGRLRWFNRAMAVLLLLTAWSTVVDVRVL